LHPGLRLAGGTRARWHVERRAGPAGRSLPGRGRLRPTDAASAVHPARIVAVAPPRNRSRRAAFALPRPMAASRPGLWAPIRDRTDIVSTIQNLPSSALAAPADLIGGDPLGAAVERGTTALLAEQRPDGHWAFELEADATIPAEYVLLRHFLGEPDPPERE